MTDASFSETAASVAAFSLCSCVRELWKHFYTLQQAYCPQQSDPGCLLLYCSGRTGFIFMSLETGIELIWSNCSLILHLLYFFFLYKVSLQ